MLKGTGIYCIIGSEIIIEDDITSPKKLGTVPNIVLWPCPIKTC